MKDEIKEILEDKKQYVEYWESENMWSQQIEYDRKILDHITNLQEEKDYYFKKNNELSTLNTSLRNDRDIYKTRNEKAIDKLYCYGEIFDGKILQQFQKEMLEILQGSDE